MHWKDNEYWIRSTVSINDEKQHVMKSRRKSYVFCENEMKI